MTDANTTKPRPSQPMVTGSGEELKSAANHARWIALAVAVLLAVFVGIMATRPSPQAREAKGATSPMVGKQAPEIAGVALDGRNVDLAQLRGRWVVVNFFASWCGPCADEHPELVAFANKFNAAGLDSPATASTAQPVTLLSVANQDSRTNVEKFFREKGGSWPVVPSENGDVAISYGARGLPETFIVNPDGIVTAHITGGVTVSELAKQTSR